MENHCSLAQQKLMLRQLHTKLGDKLYVVPINGNSFVLPSPEQLKFKILLKVAAGFCSRM